ncbi:MAG: DUF1572 domain-containing protein [Bacteroidetes bacterium]|nr:DUF1572 domain-containing protein [Bacteroidota bacterium]
MLLETILLLFERDLNKLITEIELYKNEDNIWRVDKNISNSAGNLTLHLIGNLNTYIGKEIGKINYFRNRELEFSQKNIPRQELIKNLKDTINVVSNSLLTFPTDELENEYPILVFTEKTSTVYFLIHLTTHLSYHLGQINYHRRLIEE